MKCFRSFGFYFISLIFLFTELSFSQKSDTKWVVKHQATRLASLVRGDVLVFRGKYLFSQIFSSERGTICRFYARSGEEIEKESHLNPVAVVESVKMEKDTLVIRFQDVSSQILDASLLKMNCSPVTNEFTFGDLSQIMGGFVQKVSKELFSFPKRRISLSELSPIGYLVSLEDGRGCTASLVEGGRVLTAAHCVFHMEGHFKYGKKKKKIYFVPGARQANTLLQKIDGQISTPYRFKPKAVKQAILVNMRLDRYGKSPSSGRFRDVSVGELSLSADETKDLVRKIGSFPVISPKDFDPMKGKREIDAVIAGYPMSRWQVQWGRKVALRDSHLRHGCKIKEDAPQNIENTSNFCKRTDVGYSGAPILVDIEGKLHVLGVHYASRGGLFRRVTQRYGVATIFSEFLDLLK